MKKGMLIATLFSLLGIGYLPAQVSDDVYFDPDKDRVAVPKQRMEKSSYSDYDGSGYANSYDDEYDYYNDYDYYYTSRIRRFHRPYYGFNFFDPIYVDACYYDRLLMPGVSVLIYDDVFSNRYFSRWNRWNSFGPGWNSFGPGVQINVFNSFNSFGGFNTWGWDPWYGNNSWNSWNRWNRWNSWGFGGPYLFNGFSAIPPSWGNGYIYNTGGNMVEDRGYFGPRTGGSATGPAPGSRPGRGPGITDNSPGVAPRTIQTTGGRITESDRDRIPANTGSPRDNMSPHSERLNPQTRDVNRYPTTPRQTESSREFGGDRTAPSNREGYNNPGIRATPAPRTASPQPSTAPRSYTPPARTYDRNGSSAYDRPSNTQGNSGFDRPRSTSSGFESPRSNPSPSWGGSSPSSSPRSAPAASPSPSSGGRIKN